MSVLLAKSRIERRIQKLQARLTDASGLVPGSTGWLDYWDSQYARFLSGETKTPFGRVELMFFER